MSRCTTCLLLLLNSRVVVRISTTTTTTTLSCSALLGSALKRRLTLGFPRSKVSTVHGGLGGCWMTPKKLTVSVSIRRRTLHSWPKARHGKHTQKVLGRKMLTFSPGNLNLRALRPNHFLVPRDKLSNTISCRLVHDVDCDLALESTTSTRVELLE